jgi:hypothetical protein
MKFLAFHIAVQFSQRWSMIINIMKPCSHVQILVVRDELADRCSKGTHSLVFPKG